MVRIVLAGCAGNRATGTWTCLARGAEALVRKGAMHASATFLQVARALRAHRSYFGRGFARRVFWHDEGIVSGLIEDNLEIHVRKIQAMLRGNLGDSAIRILSQCSHNAWMDPRLEGDERAEVNSEVSFRKCMFVLGRRLVL